MATYEQKFPPTPDGYANPRASLPPAEQLCPESVFDAQPLAIGDPFEDGYNIAWTHIEYLLATPDTAEDRLHLTVARQQLEDIVGHPDATLMNQHVLNARLLLSTLPGFLYRAHSMRIPPQVTDEAQQGVGQTLLDFIDQTQALERRYRVGMLSEVAALYAQLCNREFPFLGSPREESNQYWQDNHDHSIIEPGGKIPFSVKHVGVPDHENPLVVTLRMGIIALRAARKTGVEVTKDNALDALAAVMGKTARGEFLEEPKEIFLYRALSSIKYQTQKFREAGYSNVRVDIPRCD